MNQNKNPVAPRSTSRVGYVSSKRKTRTARRQSGRLYRHTPTHCTRVLCLCFALARWQLNKPRSGTADPCGMGIPDIYHVSGKCGDALESERSAPALLLLLSELRLDLRASAADQHIKWANTSDQNRDLGGNARPHPWKRRHSPSNVFALQ